MSDLKERQVHRLENSADDAGNASEEKTAREEGFSPDDVHHQENHYVGRDLCLQTFVRSI